MSTVVPIRPRAADTADPVAVSVLVGAGSGGATATTTALGIAAALAAPMFPVVVADGVVGGGNLFTRAAAAPVSAPAVVAGLPAQAADTATGAIALGGADRMDPALVDSLVASRGAARVVDIGTAVDNPALAGLRRTSALVLCSIVRAEPLTRLRDALDRIAAVHGRPALARTVVVLTHTLPTPVLDLNPVVTGLTRATAAVIEVPFDPGCAAPGLLDARALAPSSLSAYARIAAAALTALPARGAADLRRQENA